MHPPHRTLLIADQFEDLFMLCPDEKTRSRFLTIENRPGNLPLLEFALTLLWEAHSGDRLTHADYEAIGKVEGVLAQYANDYYDRLTETEHQKIQTIFMQMIQPG